MGILHHFSNLSFLLFGKVPLEQTREEIEESLQEINEMARLRVLQSIQTPALPIANYTSSDLAFFIDGIFYNS